MAASQLSQLPQVPQGRGRRSGPNPGGWPRLMRAETAAAYCDERSVAAFTKRVGTVYPRSIHISGRGKVWVKAQLDQAIKNLSGEAATIEDAASLL